ncbi:MAG: type II toxin-antitoxin system RelE/ParE family toxin [Synergistaceae bacterium]|nr:type II toxin-antitoxin system RelE/ParE family toxin [Synergistaceae bacterium]
MASLPRAYADRIIKATEKLTDNPHPHGCKKLKGMETWRIRVDNYRVVYEIHDDVLIVLVVRVAHRREVYKT